MSDNTTPDNTPVDTSPWISKIADPELIGAAQTKGWDKLDPVEAFQQAAKAHRNAEKMLGAPADNLLRLPTRDDDEAGWRNVWQRLGAPQKPEDYAFDGLDLDDAEATQRFQTAIRQTAAEIGVPKAMAERMAQTFHKFIGDSKKADVAVNTATEQEQRQQLEQDWGAADSPRFKANLFVADQAYEKLNVSAEARDKMKEGMGAAAVAKLFHKIGVMMGEDRFVTGTNPANSGYMSREQAIARVEELKSDHQWVSRYLSGGSPEKQEMIALNRVIVGS